MRGQNYNDCVYHFQHLYPDKTFPSQLENILNDPAHGFVTFMASLTLVKNVGGSITSNTSVILIKPKNVFFLTLRCIITEGSFTVIHDSEKSVEDMKILENKFNVPAANHVVLNNITKIDAKLVIAESGKDSLDIITKLVQIGGFGIYKSDGSWKIVRKGDDGSANNVTLTHDHAINGCLMLHINEWSFSSVLSDQELGNVNKVLN